jgi:hypothetical protein
MGTSVTSPVFTDASESRTLEVICGANRLLLQDLQGKSVEQVRNQLREALNIGEDHTVVLLNGQEVKDTRDTFLNPLDTTLEFIKPAGQKG